jgi:hypothetical protein
MLYFLFDTNDGRMIQATPELPKAYRSKPDAYTYRGDIKDFADAERIASLANMLADGYTYVAVDAGPQVSPRFDVVRGFQVGDAVSRSFNGDSYPVGTVTKVSGANGRIVTVSDGQSVRAFYRRKLTASWVEKGGGFCLSRGIHEKRNPER